MRGRASRRAWRKEIYGRDGKLVSVKEYTTTGTDGGTYGGSTPDTKLRETYNYLRAPANDRTTEHVANIQYAGKNYSASAVYAYDEKGNVKSVTDGGRYTSYGYDGMSRLTRENNQGLGFTKTYEYDANGNILAVKKYAYTTATSLGTPVETAEYTYDILRKRYRNLLDFILDFGYNNIKY